jgi:hypothetical protein
LEGESCGRVGAKRSVDPSPSSRMKNVEVVDVEPAFALNLLPEWG